MPPGSTCPAGVAPRLRESEELSAPLSPMFLFTRLPVLTNADRNYMDLAPEVAGAIPAGSTRSRYVAEVQPGP